jgi:hypothetical protein
VKSVKNVNGSVYRLSTDYANNKVIRDRETVNSQVVNSNLVVYLDEAFTIPSGAIVEVVLEVLTPSTFAPNTDLGITALIKGENQDALRTSLNANYHVASKAIAGMYTGVLYPVTINSQADIITVNFDGASVAAFEGATALGMATTSTKEKDNQYYIWYKSNDPQQNYYTMLPVASIDGLGTTTIVVYLDPRKSVNAGTVQIPLMMKMNTLPAITDASTAYAFYNYRPYQCVSSLPEELVLEVMKGSDFVYVSNLGTGSSMTVDGVPYAIPLEHIAIADDSVSTDNFFSNVDDLNFQSFSVDTGFVKLPGIISRNVGEDITLSSPNNTGDRLGRSYYRACSENFVAQAEGLVVGTPRKVFVPMICRVRSDVTAPIMRGELVMVLFTKAYKARLENKTGIYEDDAVEYVPGYLEEVDTAISVYRLTNKPIVRK